MRRPWVKGPEEVRFLPVLVAIATGIVVGLVARAAIVPDLDAALVEMGFDPDRARLIDALLVAFVAAGAARIVANHAVGAVVGGLAALGLVFGAVFRSETLSAVAARGVEGTFDPAGWAETALALVVVGWLVVVAGELLGLHVRNGLVVVARDLRTLRHPASLEPGRLVRLATLVAGLVAIVVGVPIFGDMVNYTPDAHMRAGAALGPALVSPGTLGQAVAGGVDASGSAGVTPPRIVAPAGTLASTAPWLAWRPTGSGRFVAQSFPAPWTGGRSTTASVTIYLPPGYDTSPSRHYPVVYEAPFAPGPLAPYLDGEITSGLVPPEIVVFVSEYGGPFPDSECANSADGRESFESFLTRTVVPWVDGHLRTIPTAAARTIYGASQGGFCAAMLATRHPNLFGQAIALSGYYTAGVMSSQTINAWRPFGGNLALVAGYSPIGVAPTLPAAVRSRLFFVLGGDPAQAFYGPQLSAFDSVLTKAHIAHAVLHDTVKHSWRQFEQNLPTALHLVALRQVALGVFRGTT